ncbi:MAG: DUF305 domain-containing protein [Longimicrobiales bacterium]
MMSTCTTRLRHQPLTTLAGALLLFAWACNSGADKTADTSAPAATDSMSATQPATSSDGMNGMQMAMTGDPDRDFLRMMSDHHNGMIEMVHATVERKDVPDILTVAKRIDTSQDAELDQMVTMLENDYKDAYAPMLMPEAKKMADDLARKTGKGYERAFYEHTIMHHEAAIKMVDAYLPKSTKPAVKQMAEKIRLEQSKEIAEFKAKLAAMKS